MDIERFREACLALPRAVEEMPFGDDVLTLKVAGKCFAFVSLRGDDLDAYLKCEPEYALQLRAHYEAITPARSHLNRQHWNSVYLDRGLPSAVILHLLRHSYRRVVAGLSRSQRSPGTRSSTAPSSSLSGTLPTPLLSTSITMDTSLLEFIDQVDSTNTYLMEQIASGRRLPQLHTVVGRQQTAGRGMRGNSWVSRQGDSVTCSLLLRSDMLQGRDQFAVSELIAVAVSRTFASFMTEEQRERLSIKWPNDIYWGDRKLAGILIEHSLTGQRVDYSVVGIGMNVNDESFPPELPFAISLRMITGHSLLPMEILIRLHDQIAPLLPDFLLGHYADVHRTFMRQLYRREGFHLFTDVQGQFRAQIKDVSPEGRLVLQREDGWERAYAFKEVRFDAE